MWDDQGENFGLASSVASDEDESSDDEILKFLNVVKSIKQQKISQPEPAKADKSKAQASVTKVPQEKKVLLETSPSSSITKAATSIAQIVTKALVHELMPPPAPLKVNSPPIIASIVTPALNRTSEAAPEDEDNAVQNLLDDTCFLTQFDDEFNDSTETAVGKEKITKKKVTKKRKVEKQKIRYHCDICNEVCSSKKKLQIHFFSLHSSTSESNKKTEQKRVVAVPCVSAPMVATGQQTDIVSLPRGRQVRQQINAQPVLANAAVSSAGGHHIRVSAPGIQTRPPLAGGRNVVINQSGSQISVPLHALQSMQAGKFFCQFFLCVVFSLKIRQMAECCVKFSS